MCIIYFDIEQTIYKIEPRTFMAIFMLCIVGNIEKLNLNRIPFFTVFYVIFLKHNSIRNNKQKNNKLVLKLYIFQTPYASLH